MSEPIQYLVASTYVEARHVATAQRLTGDGRIAQGERPWRYLASPDTVRGLQFKPEQIGRCYGYYERNDLESFERELMIAGRL